MSFASHAEYDGKDGVMADKGELYLKFRSKEHCNNTNVWHFCVGRSTTQPHIQCVDLIFQFRIHSSTHSRTNTGELLAESMRFLCKLCASVAAGRKCMWEIHMNKHLTLPIFYPIIFCFLPYGSDVLMTFSSVHLSNFN